MSTSDQAQPPGGPGDPTPAQVPTCYRHPARETYVRCNRCERPICPDCMVEASVGFQCPECVAEGSKSVRPARTIAGGLVTSNVGVVTRVLIGITVAAFIGQQLYGDAEAIRAFGALGLGIYDNEVHGIAAGESYRLVTAAFLHGGILHLLLNMYVLWVIGTPVEAALGRVRYLALYLVSAFIGCVASYMFNAPTTTSVGASGAVFGLFGAYLVIAHRMNRDVKAILVLIGLNLAIGFVVPNIDWRAHLGGLVAGAVLAAVFVFTPQRIRVPAAWIGSIGVVLVGVALVAVRTEQLRSSFPFLFT